MTPKILAYLTFGISVLFSFNLSWGHFIVMLLFWFAMCKILHLVDDI